MPRHKRRIIIPEVIEIAASLQRANVRRGTRPQRAKDKASNHKPESQSLDDKLSKFKFLVGGSNESSH